MMKHINCFILLLSIIFVLPTSAYALDAAEQTSSVFKFQQKLATKGNARAQFKLACMYESGTGVKQDMKQAKHWFDKAATAGIKSASDRMIYLSVKEHGYDRAKNSTWLNDIKKDAKESKGDAMFLLAQLYRQGIGVKKDLNKSLEILDKVSLLGAADTDEEVELILAEIKANNKSKAKAQNRKKREAARLAQEKKQLQIQQNAKKVPPVAATKPEAKAGKDQQKVKIPEQKLSKSALKKQQKVQAEKDPQAEKIRRYEKAMRQLQLEQKLIDEQQNWATGGEASTADDEI